MSPLYDFTVSFEDADGAVCEQALSINVNPACGAISPSISGIVWVTNHTFMPGCTQVFGIITNGVCASWKIQVDNAFCGSSGSLEWNGHLCNLGTPYIITVNAPSDSFGSSLPPVPTASLSLDINGINVSNDSHSLADFPRTLSVSGTIPTSGDVILRVYMACGGGGNPTPSYGIQPLGGNLTITPLFHP